MSFTKNEKQKYQNQILCYIVINKTENKEQNNIPPDNKSTPERPTEHIKTITLYFKMRLKSLQK